MHALSSIFVLGSCAVQTVLGRPESVLRNKRDGAIVKRSVDSFIQTETPIAWEKLLCNIGSSGCAASGAASGAVVASPSKQEPDYWYTWTRDSALVLTGIVDSFSQNYSASLQGTIQNYITATAKLQGVSNPSGSLSDGTGLGEAKFNVDLTAFTGDWGRPQRDGPPLRAIALTRYSKWLIQNGYTDTAKAVWPVIQNDLAYTAQYWNETGFDLWEEIKGSSFFAVGSAHRALVEGADLAAQLSTECRACITVAPQVLCFLQTFWNPNGGFVVSNINGGESRSGKDLDSILTSIHTFDPSVGCDANTFQPCSDKALSNHKVYVDSFRSVYGINSGIAAGKAVAVGRYSEDVYYNGNPWYLANFAAAEQLYDAIFVWKKDGSIKVTDLSLAFFKDLVPGIATGTYDSASTTFTSIINAVSAYADGFIDIASKYTPSGGALAEQYSRDNGSPLSAADLTWSYAAFLSVADRRAGIVPDGWSAENGNTLPATCERTQVAGTYAQAAAPSFPPSQTPNPSADPAPAPFPTTCAADDSAVYVQFNGKVVTKLGQSVKVVGSVAELGKWDVKKAVPLSASGYTGDSNPLWSITVPIAKGSSVQYKYIRVESDGTVTWESDPNRTVTVSGVKSEGTGCLAQSVNDTWR
ncbi:Six-hairpin glycosidase-like protein [Chaetomium sp. MPI-SDFR-AT-0129]|nr:Six-hairpin glycosidase-like protein [Chaetomium sp. MPI-SDFR-AT-0129]